jgi:hypothetical protein
MSAAKQKVLELDQEANKRVVKKIGGYWGQLTTLEKALGALVLGQHYGWRVLKIIHNPTTYKQYEDILGVKFQDVCDERTPFSRRCQGLRAADKLESFWAVVRGKRKVPNKGISSPE